MATVLLATTAAHALGRSASQLLTAGATAMAVQLYAAPNNISASEGGWVGEFSRPGKCTMLTGHGPTVTAVTAATQKPAAAVAAIALPVGSRPSRQAKPAIWKSNQPSTQFRCGRAGTPANRAASSEQNVARTSTGSAMECLRNRGSTNGAIAVSMV